MLMSDNTLLCQRKLESVKNINMHLVLRKHLRFPWNSEFMDSKEMFPWY